MNGTLSKNKKELHHSLKQRDEGQKLTSAVKTHEMEPSVEIRHHNHQGGHEMETSMTEIEGTKSQTTTT